MKLWEQIKKLRKQRSWTQDKMAEKICLTPSAISQYENGKREMNLSTLEEIAEQLGMEVRLVPKTGDVVLQNEALVVHPSSIIQGLYEKQLMSKGY